MISAWVYRFIMKSEGRCRRDSGYSARTLTANPVDAIAATLRERLQRTRRVGDKEDKGEIVRTYAKTL